MSSKTEKERHGRIRKIYPDDVATPGGDIGPEVLDVKMFGRFLCMLRLLHLLLGLERRFFFARAKLENIPRKKEHTRA